MLYRDFYTIFRKSICKRHKAFKLLAPTAKFVLLTWNLWASIQNPVIHGYGYGNVSDGFDGIVDAAKDALKNAVREHYRAKIKNKPKEITGSVLIRKEPLIGIDEGRYTIKLDFFLEYDTIINYNVY